MSAFQITEEAVRRMADSASFQRGKAYYAGGAVFNPVAFGDEIHARCRGSSYTSYEVRIKLGSNGISAFSCTCPRGGFCKHIVAVCLARLHDPQSFRELPSAEQILAGFSREQLVGLVKRMLEYEPGLLSLLETADQARQGQLDEKTWLQLADEAWRHEDIHRIERKLQGLLDTARDMADNGDWVGAGTVCQAVLTTLARNYDNIRELDEHGDIACFAGESVELLAQCLAGGNPDGNRRARWFDALLAVELADTALGGIDLAPGAFDLIVEHATEEEWVPLEEQIRNALPRADDWSRRSLSNMLGAWPAAHGRPEARAAVIRETGTPEQIAFLLVEEGKPEEALALTRESLLHLPGLVTALADRLVREGYPEQTVAFMVDVAGKDSAFIEWLVQYHLEREEWAKALEWQERHFLEEPSCESFLAVGDTAGKTGDWDRLRPQLLQVLEGKGRWRELLAIALAEGDVRRALDLYSRHSSGFRPDICRELARAAEKDFPAEAAAVYREMAQAHIDRQQRESYHQAAQYLLRVKTLWERTGDAARWQRHIAGLKARYPRHRAL